MNYKSIALPIVGALILGYESITGHQVAEAMKNEIVDYAVAIASFGVTIYGIYKNHKKGE